MARIMMDKCQSYISLQEAFEAFIKKCKLKNLSKHSIHYYEESFNYLCKVTDKTGSVSQLNADSLQSLVRLLKPTMKDISINTRLKGIRIFVNYCIEMGYIKQFKVQLIKADTTVKTTYSELELKTLLEKPNVKECQFTTLRTWTAINILIGTGCRIGSLQALKIKDINFEESMIKFTKTKGRKQLLIPISKHLNDVLKLYLQYRNGQPDDFLICNQYGEEIERNGLIHAIAKYNRSKGVLKTSCHLFRHTFAKHWIINNGDIFRLQKILGHEDIKVTQQYLKDFGSYNLQDSFDKYNILESVLSRDGKKRIYMKNSL